jgi:hypothetical protein
MAFKSFVVALRTGWDASDKPHALILEEFEADRDAGVDHVIAVSWQPTFDGWRESVVAFAELLALREVEGVDGRRVPIVAERSVAA